jgi:hypothetical protein
MERIVTRIRYVAVLAVLLSCLPPALASAQEPSAAAPSDEGIRPWIVVGAAWTTLLGTCTNCEGENYLNSGGFMADAGVSINKRTEFGGEVLWVPETLTTGDEIRVTFLMATAQFRPWETHGFFLKGGAGMAFLKNWLDAFENTSPPVRSKAFSLVLGTGWEWKVRGRFGLQVFGAHHVAALGDLQAGGQTVENVMGNFWSLGTSVVFR